MAGTVRGPVPRPTWQNLLVLLAGTILAPGRRTVTSALSILGLREVAGFTNYRRVLNRNRWPTRAAAKHLLHLLLRTFVPSGPVIIGIDETIERRWGPKIKAVASTAILSAPAAATS